MSASGESHLAFEPWFEDVLRAAAIARGARVLVLEAHSPAQSAAILVRIGASGALTVVEPDPERAAAVDALAHPGLGVLAYRAQRGDDLGMHDVVLCCPPAIDADRSGELLALAVRNLRPGGRLVFDLPANGQCDALRAAWTEIGAPAEGLAPFLGVDTGAFTDELGSRALRQRETAELSYLVRFASPLDVATRVAELCGAGEAVAEALRIVLTSRLETIGEVELPFRRVRATAMR
ncbi:MAG: hypothetical protein HZB39_07830 [Planctomycetes bacterium]|nr:hypothetical protein [Planctomycetota bacterium]